MICLRAQLISASERLTPGQQSTIIETQAFSVCAHSMYPKIRVQKRHLKQIKTTSFNNLVEKPTQIRYGKVCVREESSQC